MKFTALEKVQKTHLFFPSPFLLDLGSGMGQNPDPGKHPRSETLWGNKSTLYCAQTAVTEDWEISRFFGPFLAWDFLIGWSWLIPYQLLLCTKQAEMLFRKYLVGITHSYVVIDLVLAQLCSLVLNEWFTLGRKIDHLRGFFFWAETIATFFLCLSPVYWSFDVQESAKLPVF